MILDMIQGCWYLRRSTDRWLLSKNSTTRLKDTKDGIGPVCCEIVRFFITNAKGSYLYPCPNTTPGRPRLLHLLPKLMSQRQCPSCTRHQFVPYILATSSRILGCFLLQAQNSPSAEWWRAPDRRHLYRMLWGKFPVEWCFLTKLGPQVSLFHVPIFGVNTQCCKC
jgi:hypothetical protein